MALIRGHHSKRCAQVTISPTFYAQLLSAQIPNSAKKTDGLIVFFALLGSLYVKAVCKMLLKSTPGLNFTNILQAAFLYTKVCCAVFLYLQFGFKNFCQKTTGAKATNFFGEIATRSNFIYIFRAAFMRMFFCQKIAKRNFN